MALLEEKWELFAERLNERLISHLKSRGCLKDERIEKALRKMRRHYFLESFYSLRGQYTLDERGELELALRAVYADDALMLSWGEEHTTMASISQPSIVVEMLEELKLDEGMRVLEIGTGTGWNAALIASVVGLSGKVVTIEISKELSQKAKERIYALELADIVEVIHGDGRFGAEKFAPFDRIICTAGAEMVYHPWIEQLVNGGILITPTDGLRDFCPMLKIRRESDRLIISTLTLARFVPIVAQRKDKEQPEAIAVSELIHAVEHNRGIYELPPSLQITTEG